MGCYKSVSKTFELFSFSIFLLRLFILPPQSRVATIMTLLMTLIFPIVSKMNSNVIHADESHQAEMEILQASADYVTQASYQAQRLHQHGTVGSTKSYMISWNSYCISYVGPLNVRAQGDRRAG